MNHIEFQEVIDLAKSCSRTLRTFAKFVSQIEELPQAYPKYFANAVDENEFRRIWLDLEILNALALENWEESEREWKPRHEQEAVEAVEPLISLLERLQVKGS